MTRDRRRFLRLLVGWGLALSTAALGGRPRAAEVERLGEMLGDLASASVLGAEFLRLRPEEARVDLLQRLLQLPTAPVARRGAFVRQLARRQRSDFREGRIVELRGWTLSETELRLCALAHLTRETGRGSSGDAMGSPLPLRT